MPHYCLPRPIPHGIDGNEHEPHSDSLINAPHHQCVVVDAQLDIRHAKQRRRNNSRVMLDW
jgi:hypothetical protein